MAKCKELGVSTWEQLSGWARSHHVRRAGHSRCKARAHGHGQRQSAGAARGKTRTLLNVGHKRGLGKGCGCKSGRARTLPEQGTSTSAA